MKSKIKSNQRLIKSIKYHLLIHFNCDSSEEHRLLVAWALNCCCCNVVSWRCRCGATEFHVIIIDTWNWYCYWQGWCDINWLMTLWIVSWDCSGSWDGCSMLVLGSRLTVGSMMQLGPTCACTWLYISLLSAASNARSFCNLKFLKNQN